MKRPRTLVSDHAVVRYLERVEGLDVVALKAEIAWRVDYAARLGASAVIIAGYRYVIGHDVAGQPVVVTVEPHGQDTPIRRSGRRDTGDEA